MQGTGFFKRYPKTANVLILFGTLIIALGIAEVVFRLNGKYATFNEKYGKPYHSLFATDYKSWYHINPPHELASQTLSEYSYAIRANNEGLLDKDFTVEKKPHAFRIMVIGDSFVQGMGAVTDSSLPAQLQRILKKQYGDSIDIQVWNCGVANSDPFFEYMLFANRLQKYNPDYVIEVVNFTDITDVILRGGFKRFNADSTVTFNAAPWYEPLYAKSFLFRSIYHDVLGYNWLFLRPKQEEKARNNSTQMIGGVLTGFKKLCSTRGIPFLAVFHPSNYELSEKSEYSMQGLIYYCDSAHIPFTDIRACLVTQGLEGEKSKALYWPIDGHCNSLGYMYFAQCISAPVIQYLDSIQINTGSRQGG
jgi:hypothetical protein